MGNEIHKSIQLIADVPSEHEDGTLPIMDLKCWISEVQIDDKKQSMILYEGCIIESSNTQRLGNINKQQTNDTNSRMLKDNDQLSYEDRMEKHSRSLDIVLWRECKHQGTIIISDCKY